MTLSYYNFPFLGRGTAFPFRVNPNTGGTAVTDGLTDSVSVALQYIQERWTIREGIDYVANHISESIAHILFTIPGEHDTLPEFGSRLLNIIFEPNTQEFRLTAEVYFKTSTERWEKRAKVIGTEWYVDGILVDRGELPMFSKINFIVEQVPGNLVQPFVSDRQARLQEYPSSVVDINDNDLYSRYYNRVASTRDGCSYIRLRNRGLVLAPRRDDIYYKVIPTDTWLLISWYNYKDIRFSYIVEKNFINDHSDEDRSILNVYGNPESGIILRLPSKSRLLNYLATIR